MVQQVLTPSESVERYNPIWRYWKVQPLLKVLKGSPLLKILKGSPFWSCWKIQISIKSSKSFNTCKTPNEIFESDNEIPSRSFTRTFGNPKCGFNWTVLTHNLLSRAAYAPQSCESTAQSDCLKRSQNCKRFFRHAVRIGSEVTSCFTISPRAPFVTLPCFLSFRKILRESSRATSPVKIHVVCKNPCSM